MRCHLFRKHLQAGQPVDCRSSHPCFRHEGVDTYTAAAPVYVNSRSIPTTVRVLFVLTPCVSTTIALFPVSYVRCVAFSRRIRDGGAVAPRHMSRERDFRHGVEVVVPPARYCQGEATHRQVLGHSVSPTRSLLRNPPPPHSLSLSVCHANSSLCLCLPLCLSTYLFRDLAISIALSLSLCVCVFFLTYCLASAGSFNLTAVYRSVVII